MKNAIVKLGFSFLLFCIAGAALAAPPTVSNFTLVGPAVTNSTTITINVTFSEAVTGFGAEASDVTLSGTGAAGVVATVGGSGTNYTITLTGLATNGQIDVQIPGGAASATNPPNDLSAASGIVSVVFDNTAPTITSLAKRASPVQPDPTSSGPVFFTVAFSEAVSGFATNDIDFTGSTTGVGTLSATTVTQTSALTWDIEIALSGSAVAGDVQINIPSSKVTDAAGNANTASTNAKVVYAGGTPSQNTPTVTNISVDGAQLNGNVTAANGSTITGRGFIISTTSPVAYIAGAAANKISVGGTTGAFDTGTTLNTFLSSGTRYYFISYVEYGASSHTISSEQSFYTFSALPDGHPSFSVTPTSPTSISITSISATSINNDMGYLIVRRQGGSAVPNASSGEVIQDGVAPAGLNYAFCSCTLVANVTPSSNSNFVDPATLSVDTEYTYALIIYNWDGTHPETYNYRSGFTSNSGTTFSRSSSVQYVSADASLDYIDYQDADITSNSNSAKLATLRLKDGNDSDGVSTELTQIQIKFDNYQNLRTITIWENGLTIGEQTIVAGQDTYTFNIPAGEIEAGDDGTDDFDVRGTFKAVVTDQHQIKLTVMAVTANPNKSGFANSTGGSATTPGGTNLINVATSKLVFTSVTGGTIIPGATFSATVQARDALDNVDTNNTSNIKISASTGGPLQFGGAEPDTKALSGGIAQWTQLKFQFAGSKVLLAEKVSGSAATNATYNLSIESTGVTIVQAGALVLCFNSVSNTDPASFVTLPGSITVTESDPSDFTPGTGITFSLKLPDDYIFDTSVTPTPVIGGSNISGMQPVSYPTNNIVRLTFTVTGTTGSVDFFTISNLRVKYTKTVPKASAPIVRFGGSAIIKGNDEDLAKPHGSVSAASTAPAVDFKNVNVNATETRFNATQSAITLQGITSPGGTDLNGVFTGNGVVKGADGKYKFYPQNVDLGVHKITFTYQNPSAPFCLSVAQKDYEVYTSSFTGLNTEYCIDGAPSTITGVAPGSFPSEICSSPTSAAFGQPRFRLKGFLYLDWNIGWLPLPDDPSPSTVDKIFDPANPAYQQIYRDTEINWGVHGILIAFEVFDDCVPTPNPPLIYPYNLIAVPVYRKPQLSFTVPAVNMCNTATSFTLTGVPAAQNNGYDEFWTSVENNTTTLLPGVSGSAATSFTFSPLLALNGQPNSQRVQINYRYRQQVSPTLQCTNQIAKVVEVFAKPTAPAASDITAKATPGNIAPEFCETETITQFTAATYPNTIYNWYDNSYPSPGFRNLAPETDKFNPATFLTDGNNDLRPDITTTQFKITRTTNKFTGFDGCQSDPLLLSVRIDQAPKIDFTGLNVKVCGANPVTLADLGASITPGLGHPALGGTWSSEAIAAPTSQFEDQLGAKDYSFATARRYTPAGSEVNPAGFKLRLTTDDPDGECSAVSRTIDIGVNNPIDIVAEADFAACPDTNESIAVRATLVSGNATITWSENGLGSLVTGTADKLTTTYQPQSTELTGQPTITFTVTTSDPDGPGPCNADTDDVEVTINTRAKLQAAPNFTVCSDQSIQLGVTIPAGSSATSYAWSGGGAGSSFSNINAANPTYTPAPAELTDPNTVVFTVTSNDPDGPTGPCPVETSQMSVTINPKPAPPTTTIPGSPIARLQHCVNDAVGNLTAVGAELRWYADAALTDIRGSGGVFTSGVTSNTDKEVTFWATQTTNKSASFAGCQSVGLPITVVINPLPDPMFDASSFCFGDGLQLEDQSTVKPGTPARSITEWKWTFDDGFALDFGSGAIAAGTHNGTTAGTYDKPIHNYGSLGNYNVKLEVKSSDGCVNSVTSSALPALGSKPIRIGAYPVANFSHAKVCDGDQTAFQYSGTIGSEIASYAWDFGDAASASNSSTATSPTHLFTGVSTYNVSLTVTSVLGCANTIVKDVSILPYIKSFPYIESFEGPGHGWVSQGLNSNGFNSWNLKGATNNIILNPQGGSKFWVTQGPDGTYKDNERSVLIGPCVDLTKLERPVVSLDFWNDTDPKSDGAYVEISTDEGATWVRLGDAVNSGLEWYNDNSIGGLAQLNGIGQTVGQFGWSGKSTEWKTGKFNLDAYSNQTKLRMRIVFGSNSSQPIDGTVLNGFAMDYFKLERRNRLVLVENFTNATAQLAVSNANSFKSFPSVAAANEVVKIQYHTGFPGEDAIYAQNPMDPNARASFYGLSAAPRGYIDGYSEATGMFVGSSWATDYYSKQSLVNAPIDIKINNPTSANGVLTVTGSVQAVELPLKANEYSLYLAVVEETVGANSFVLRKMLPSASGRKVPATALNQSFNFSESWAIDASNVADPTKLVVVAFVQADVADARGSRRVLQAAVNRNIPSITVTTGLDLPLLEQTAIYPNPADHLLNIELPEATRTGVEVKVIDQLGRAVVQSEIAPGERSRTLDVGDLAGTVYIVQLKENGHYTTRRLLVRHKH